MGSTHHHPLLAGYSQSGVPWVHPAVKRELGITVHNRIMRHQRTFLRELKKPNVSWSLARKKALKQEHKNLTPKQRQKYEGKLGALERKLKKK
jgi:hypothetical protein